MLAIAVAAASLGYVVLAEIIKPDRVPLTITYEIREESGKLNSIQLKAIRSDGSTATSTKLAEDSMPAAVDVEDIALKRTFVKDPVQRAYDDLPMTGRQKRKLEQVPISCKGAFGAAAICGPVQQERILGHEVHLVTVPFNGDHNRRLEIYAAPALNFLPLRTLSYRNGELHGRWDAVDVRLGEPDASLFELPSDYERARSPGLFLDNWSRARGKPSIGEEAIRNFDELQDKKRQHAETDPVRSETDPLK
jgi:hypothetical protein